MAEADIEELKAVLLAGNASGSFNGVWPANRSAIDAFLAVASQWRTAMSVEEGRLKTMFIGLDYAGAAVAWAAHHIDLTAELLAGIQIIEMSARRALNGGDR